MSICCIHFIGLLAVGCRLTKLYFHDSFLPDVLKWALACPDRQRSDVPGEQWDVGLEDGSGMPLFKISLMVILD